MNRDVKWRFFRLTGVLITGKNEQIDPQELIKRTAVLGALGIFPEPSIVYAEDFHVLLSILQEYTGIHIDWEKATFYGDFQDTLEMPEELRRVYQCMNYATRYWIPALRYYMAYGKLPDAPEEIEFSPDSVFVPFKKDKTYRKAIESLKNLRRVRTISEDRIVDFIAENYIYAARPFKVDEEFKWLLSLYVHLGGSIQVGKVKNRELRAVLIEGYLKEIDSVRPEDVLRYVYYKALGMPIILKARRHLRRLKGAPLDSHIIAELFKRVTSFDEFMFSYKQHRKPWRIILARFIKGADLSHAPEHIRKIVKLYRKNRLDKIAKNYRTPDYYLEHGDLERSPDTLVARNLVKAIRTGSSLFALEGKLRNASVRALVGALLSARLRKLYSFYHHKFKIPLQHLIFIRSGTMWPYPRKTYFENLLDDKVESILKDILREKLNADWQWKVKGYDPSVLHAINSSSKFTPFPGIPAFSVIRSEALDSRNGIVVGIHWTEEKTDIDLSAVVYAFDGNSWAHDFVSWNTNFVINVGNMIRAIHTGDMTHAPKETGASELVYVQPITPNANFVAIFDIRVYSSTAKNLGAHFVVTLPEEPLVLGTTRDEVMAESLRVVDLKRAVIAQPIDFYVENSLNRPYLSVTVVAYYDGWNIYISPARASFGRRVWIRHAKALTFPYFAYAVAYPKLEEFVDIRKYVDEERGKSVMEIINSL